MRITRETLLKVARENADLLVRQDRSIVTIFLTGSLLSEEPLIGGVTDIDLFVIHNSQPLQERELIRLTDEVQLDIAHQPQSVYQQPRLLRTDPWLGPVIYANPILLHDTQHWFEFVQASERSQFTRADYVLDRARPFAESARQAWLGLRSRPAVPSPDPVETLHTFLLAVESAANAIASLSGGPLTLRRLLLAFPERASAVRNPDLYGYLLGLVGASQVDPGAVRGWIPAWSAAFDDASSQASVSLRLHPFRKLYYERAFEAMLAGEHPQNALWPLLFTWTLSLCSLKGSPSHQAVWLEACQHLGMAPENWDHSLSALDSFLDRVEETLDRWSAENGLS